MLPDESFPVSWKIAKKALDSVGLSKSPGTKDSQSCFSLDILILLDCMKHDADPVYYLFLLDNYYRVTLLSYRANKAGLFH